MIDRHARDIAAEAIREFVKGSISNRQYEQRYPESQADPALCGIYTQVWFWYSDVSEHTLSGKHEVQGECRELVERCLLFLRSDLEFQWPLPRFRPLEAILRLLGLGRIVKRWIEKEMSIGDKEVWPFLKKADYAKALQDER